MLEIINILQLIKEIGERDVKNHLSSFNSLNAEVEDFVHNKAIDLAKRKVAITYLVVQAGKKDIIGIFTIANKALEISVDNEFSNTFLKKIKAFSSDTDETIQEKNSITVAAYLLAQFSKNSNFQHAITGERLLEEALKKLKEIQLYAGGSLLWLECEDNNKPALEFYNRENFGFQFFGTRYSNKTKTKYIQMIKSF